MKKTTKKGRANIKQDKEFYKKIWEYRYHICVNCDKPLREPNLWNFAHVLAKGAYPKFRHYERNIILLCWECHVKLDCEDKTTMRCWMWLEGLTQELKQEYFKKN